MGLALLDAPVPLPLFALYLQPYGSPVSDKGCNQSINQFTLDLDTWTRVNLNLNTI